LREETLYGKFTRRVAAGDRLIVETPGGGGYGSPD
jgi:N-methylhydantoinase B/oxoprolinase/acetone carboxylase alpha subunit